MRSSSAWRVRLLAIAAGAFYFLSFPPYDLHPLGWVALVPLVIAIRRSESGRRAFLAGATTAMVTVLGGYFWIADTAHRFWQAPWPFAILLLLIYGTFAQIHFTVFAWLSWRSRRVFDRAPALCYATLFTACEIVVPRIFPDKLGHTQIDSGALAFASALVGTHGLTFAVAWVAASAAVLLDGAGRERRRLVELGLALAAVAGLGLGGARQESTFAASPIARTLDVAIVQSNLGDPEALATDLGSVTQAIDSTIAMYLGLTYRSVAGRHVDFVVWPETALPSMPRPRVLAPLQVMVGSLGTPLLFGGYDSERLSGSRWRLYNAAFHMAPNGDLVDRYYKHKLLLFGEYVPFSERFPVLIDLLPTPGEFTPGPGPEVFDVGGVPLSPLICYELLFPRVVRASLRAGGQVLVNFTNDYWFGRHMEPLQHLQLTRMCAIETGRPIVRATNTGISALIDHRGQVIAQSGLWTQEVLFGRLPVPEPMWTPYARWGERVTAALAGVCWLVVGLMWAVLRPRRRAPATGEPPAESASAGHHGSPTAGSLAGAETRGGGRASA